MVVYVVALIISIILLRNVTDTTVRIVLALLPVVPIGFGLRAFMLFLSQIDELGQRIQLQGIAFAAGATGMLTMTYGFLEAMLDFPHIPLIWVFPLQIVLWGLGVAFATRRYQ
jgi:hypothetical protein